MNPEQKQHYNEIYKYYAQQLARQKETDDDKFEHDATWMIDLIQVSTIQELRIRDNGIYRCLCLLTFDIYLE